MEERFASIMSQILNEQQHLLKLKDFQCPFKASQNNQKHVKSISAKAVVKGYFFNYNTDAHQFQNFYFELFPNVLMRYSDKQKNGQGQSVILQYFYNGTETQTIENIQIYSIILEGEKGIVKMMTDKQNSFQLWQQEIQKFCKQRGFLQRYKVENRIYEHFYKCIDKRKKSHTICKIVSKKGSKCEEQKKIVENEITIIRKVQCALLPYLKKIYEDDNYKYLTFQYFRGDDLLQISTNSKLEEIAVATLAYHILKGLKVLHNQGFYHGNLKLENIIFSTSKKDNEIFIINFKYIDEQTDNYREKLIKKGNNMYIAPEILEQKPFDQQIDIFSLGVCLFQMLFKRSPYVYIEKDKYGNSYTYELDLTLLQKMKIEKKKDANSKQPLSASGIDFFLNLLQQDPKLRPSAAQAMNHSWFINFTNKQGNKRKQNNIETDLISLRTIIESSEISEREYTMLGGSKILQSGKNTTNNFLNFITQAQDSDENIYEEDGDEEDEEIDKINDDENNGVEYLMKQLNAKVKPGLVCKQKIYEFSQTQNEQINFKINDSTSSLQSSQSFKYNLNTEQENTSNNNYNQVTTKSSTNASNNNTLNMNTYGGQKMLNF